MKRLLTVLLVVVAVAMLPVAAFASEGEDEDGFMFKTGGSTVIAAGQSIGTLMVIDGDVRVEGTVRDRLIVIDGDAIVTGRVQGTVTVIDGTLNLQPTAVVKSVELVDATLTRDGGAIVLGSVREREDLVFRGFGFLFAAFIWTGMTVAVFAVGILFAVIGSRQLKNAAALLTDQPAGSIVAAVVLWLGTPVLALLLLLTLIGAPIGLGAMLFLLPILWVMGYALVGYRLGNWLTSRFSAEEEHTVIATITGLLGLQVIVLVPVLGIAVAVTAGAWGAGALTLSVWQSLQRRPMAPGVAA